MLDRVQLHDTMRAVHSSARWCVAYHLGCALQHIRAGLYFDAHREMRHATYHAAGLGPDSDELDRFWRIKMAINDCLLEGP